MSAIYPCYAVCDRVVLQFQTLGRVPALCSANSEFEFQFSACQACLVNLAPSASKFILSYITNFSENALSFCAAQPAQLESGSSGITISSSLTSSSSLCPPYPSVSLPAITSAASASSFQSTSSSSSTPSQTSTASYGFGFWLVYTFTPCPTRTANPTFAYPASCLPANYTWGCPPGYLCAPPQVDCDLEVGPPSDSYVCSPENCQPPQPLDLDALEMNTPSNTTVYSPLPLPTGYFNLNPAIFGADWGIFTGNVSVTSFSSTATLTPTSSALSTTTPPPKTSSISHAWIAGPVVGSIAGVVFVLLAVLYFVHKRRPPKTAAQGVSEGKAQLDGEGIKPKEVGANELTELEGRHVVPVEMDAGYSGAELLAAKSNIKRKPVPGSEGA